jgi:hypothetical protein
MKVRTDYVTNSSSSNFIIAIHDDATDQDVMNLFDLNDIKEFLEDYYSYDSYYKDDEEYSPENVLKTVVDIIMEADDRGIKIGQWSVYADRFSNEDEPAYAYIYDRTGNINTDKVKIYDCGS